MGCDNYKVVVMEYQLPSVPNPGGRDSDELGDTGKDIGLGGRWPECEARRCLAERLGSRWP